MIVLFQFLPFPTRGTMFQRVLWRLSLDHVGHSHKGAHVPVSHEGSVMVVLTRTCNITGLAYIMIKLYGLTRFTTIKNTIKTKIN